MTIQAPYITGSLAQQTSYVLEQPRMGGLMLASDNSQRVSFQVQQALLRSLVSANRRKRLAEEFQRLAYRWRKETDGCSLAGKSAKHPDYLAIINLREPVVPLILEEMRDRGGHWFIALSEITQENPVSKDAAGNIDLMRASWLNWGTKKGLI